jgi:hypothetical protein
MMRILKTAVLLLCFSTTGALSADITSCVEPSMRRVRELDFRSCEKLASKGKLTNHKRSQIFLNLAFTTFFGASLQKGGEEIKLREVIRLAKSSIEADPSNGDAYLSLADFYEYQSRQEEVVSVLKAGLKNVPTDLRIVAEFAAHTASPATKADVVEMCKKVTLSMDVNRDSYVACGKAAQLSGDKALAEIYLFNAIKTEEKLTSRMNDVQFGSPEDFYVDLMVSEGRGKDAAKALENALLSKGRVSYIEWEVLASLQSSVADYDGAAKYYKIAASNAIPTHQFILKFKQVIALAMAGKSQDSLHLAELLFMTSTQQQILRLQVQLKNGSQKDLIITGRFDDQTKKALSACLRERGCFKGVTGQAI